MDAISMLNKFADSYREGLKGNNRGIPMPLKKLSSFLCNIQQGSIYLLGGGTGTGKSTLVNEIAISHPIEFLEKNNDRVEKYHCEYVNLEIQDIDVIAKFKANKIFKESNGQIELSPSKIFQKGDFVLSEQEKMWISKTREYMKAMLSKIDFVMEENITVKYLYKRMAECAMRFGTAEKDEYGEVKWYTYKKNNPNQYIVFIIDNINNLEDKKEMDELAQYCVKFRKKCNFTFFIVQQYNRSLSGDRDFKEPVLSDLKETGDFADAATVALLTYAPMVYGIEMYLGYNMKEEIGYGKVLGDIIRFCKVAKNRDGGSEVTIPYAFNGARGIVEEMPSPEDWSENKGNIRTQIINKYAK